MEIGDFSGRNKFEVWNGKLETGDWRWDVVELNYDIRDRRMGA